MERTLYSLMLFGAAAFITFLLKLIFKLRLTPPQFIFIAALVGGLLATGLLFCPIVWQIHGPK